MAKTAAGNRQEGQAHVNTQTGEIKEFASDLEALKAGFDRKLSLDDAMRLKRLSIEERLAELDKQTVVRHDKGHINFPQPKAPINFPPPPSRQWKQRVRQSR
ncbi:MAG: hypothetical protein KJZ65_06635 [Phycisphaerales bacterium]|nr:hypothetical protein [Phycisphaerales bacterium]